MLDGRAKPDFVIAFLSDAVACECRDTRYQGLSLYYGLRNRGGGCDVLAHNAEVRWNSGLRYLLPGEQLY